MINLMRCQKFRSSFVLLIFALSFLRPLQAYASNECDRYAIAVTTVAVPFQTPRTALLSDRVLSSQPKRADVIMIGDSLIANWPRKMTAMVFDTPFIWNFGVNGAVTQSVVWQIEQIKTGTLSPHEVTVLVGTNNLAGKDIPACAVFEGIKAVAKAARAKWPSARVTLIGIPPRGPDFMFRDQERSAVNEDLGHWIATQVDMRFVEVSDALLTCELHGIGTVARGEPNVPSTACENYRGDLLHLTPKGYQVFGTALKQYTEN